MTYDQLVTLDAIIKCGSFKAASEFLYKSQPSLSMAIKKLEEEFQIQLFDRSEYRPRLTTEGKIFYEKAKMALVHMNSLKLFGEELGMGVEPEIRVGIDGLAPLEKILCHLRTFFADYTHTNLSLAMDHISGTRQKLLNNEIEIGFLPLMEQPEELECIEVFETNLIPVAAPEIVNEGQDTEKLRMVPQVIVTDSGKGDDKSYGVLANVRKWNVSNMESKKTILLHGLGWGRLPDFGIERELKEGSLKEISNPEIEPVNVKVYMARHRDTPKGPIAKKLWEKIKNSP